MREKSNFKGYKYAKLEEIDMKSSEAQTYENMDKNEMGG